MVTKTNEVRSRSRSAAIARSYFSLPAWIEATGPEAGLTTGLGGLLDVPAPVHGQLEQPQGVPGGRRVEDHQVVAWVHQEIREPVEGGDLGGARRAELLLDHRHDLVGQDPAHRREHLLAVGLGGVVRVDLNGEEVRHAD